MNIGTIKSKLRNGCEPVYKFLRKGKVAAYNIAYGEKEKSYGNLNPDKTFYVIRIKAEGIGLMGYYASIVGSIRYALERNWIPIVDMKNYKNAYLDDDKLGKENSWEYYFKQPTTTPLDEIYHSRYVVLSNAQTSFTGSPRKLYSEVMGGGITILS